MANKRMFDKAIIDTDKFMDMPLSSKAIYFLLGMEADDEGFVSYKKVMRIHGGNEDDIKVLLAKNLIIMFESKVVVITDWQKNNWLDTRRIKPTEYQIEKKLLTVNSDNSYSLSKCLANAKRVEKRIEEKSREENKPCVSFEKFWSIYPKKISKKKALEVWNKIKPNNNLLEVILKAIKVAKKTDQWERGFIPHPTTYLNQERWNDEFSKDDLNNDLLVIK